MLSASPSSVDEFGLNPAIINSPSTQNEDHVTKKKKKKRIREEDQKNTDDSLPVGGKNKKRKHGSEVEVEKTLIEEASATSSSDATDPSSPYPNADIIPKLKKKKKDTQKQIPLAEQTDAEIEASSQASAAALLSAIVAASVTNPEVPQMASSLFDPATVAPQQFAQFPGIQFGYPLTTTPSTSAIFDPNGSQPPSVFSAPGGVGGASAFSELSFGSNDDLLRALQNLDMSKIASVLKNLGDATQNQQAFAPQLSFMPSHLMQPHPASLGQVAAPSNTILGIPAKHTMVSSGHRRTINMNLPGNEQHINPDHAYLLANKWLNASKLAELVREEGLVYKKGKFSAIEEQQLKQAIERYQHEKQLREDQMSALIFKSDKSKDTAFWSEITAAVPLRPIIAVYHHVRRAYHPLKQKGIWRDPEDEALKQAVVDLGQQWEKVSLRVGRMASDCRDRYRNHIVDKDQRMTGHWSREEEEKLTQIVTDMTIKQGKDPDNDVFWGKVSELMGGTRGRQQCRIKWTDALSKTVKNEGTKPRWSQQDAFILVHKVDSLNVRDDTEIDWKLIPDPDWNLWSAHTLQRRWLTLKKSVKGYEDMTHQEIMDILRVKKAHLPPPPPPPPKRKEKKITSAPVVNETDVAPQSASSTDDQNAASHPSPS